MLTSKEALLKELESGKAKNLVARKLQETLQKENEEYKSQYQLLKDQRDEAQQKCLIFEQIVRHYRKEESSFQQELEDKLFIQGQIIEK